MAPFKAILSAMYVAIAGVVAALVRVIPLALGRSSCYTYLSTGLRFNANCSSSAAEPAEKLSVQTVTVIFTAKAVAAAAMRVLNRDYRHRDRVTSHDCGGGRGGLRSTAAFRRFASLYEEGGRLMIRAELQSCQLKLSMRGVSCVKCLRFTWHLAQGSRCT